MNHGAGVSGKTYRIRNFLTIAVTASLMAIFASNAAYAITTNTLPQGGNVVAGSASFSHPNSTTLDVNQSSERTVINWNSFNIGRSASVQFQQPDAKALAVNRVINSAADPTQILGTLKSNGQVMILDKNGVLFGSNAIINVGGIIASTGWVSSQQVMSGTDNIDIDNINGNAVINQGQITAAQGGLVALVAPHVSNSGVITANMGRVELAAGSAVTVDLYGDSLVSLAVKGPVANALVENAGKIQADGGRVALTARAAQGIVNNVVNMTGIVQANTVGQKDGEIVLDGGNAGTVAVSGQVNATGTTGGGVDITGNQIALNSAQIDASGTNGGGRVYVGAGPQGVADGATSPAAVTSVSAGTNVNVDATDNGNGGNVVFWGGQQMNYAGQTTARGGANGGNGGQVEVSTDAGVDFEGKVITTAMKGKVGSLLIDPDDVSIGNGSNSRTFINAQTLADELVNTSVLINAANSISIVKNSPDLSGIDLSASDLGTPQFNLTLQTATLNVGNDLNMAAAGNLALNANTINLNGKFTSGGAIIDPSRVTGTATQVNVLSNAASIQQAMDISSATQPVTVQVASGNYNENLTINKNGLILTGNDGTLTAGSDPTAPQISGTVAGGNVITVTANNVKIDGLLLNAQVGDGSVAPSVNGIYANGVDGLTISHNTLEGFTTSGISTPNSTNVALNANLNILSPSQATAGVQSAKDAQSTAQANDTAASDLATADDKAASDASQTAAADKTAASDAAATQTTKDQQAQTAQNTYNQDLADAGTAQTANNTAQAVVGQDQQVVQTAQATYSPLAVAQASADSTAQAAAAAAAAAAAKASQLDAAAKAAQLADANAYANTKAAYLASVANAEAAAIAAAKAAELATLTNDQAKIQAALTNITTEKAAANASAKAAVAAGAAALQAARIAAQRNATPSQKAAAVAAQKAAAAAAAQAIQDAESSLKADADGAIIIATATLAKTGAIATYNKAHADAVSNAGKARAKANTIARAAQAQTDANAQTAEAAAAAADQAATVAATAASQAQVTANNADAAAATAQKALNDAEAQEQTDQTAANTTAATLAADDQAVQKDLTAVQQANADATAADSAAAAAQDAYQAAQKTAADAATQAAAADQAKADADAALTDANNALTTADQAAANTALYNPGFQY